MTTFNEAVVFNNHVTFQEGVTFADDNVELPDGCITNEEIAPSAGIATDKTTHRHSKVLEQVAGTDVVARTSYIHISRASGTLKLLRVRPIAVPAGGDKQFTIDIKKVPNAIAVGSGTSLLDTPLVVNTSSVANTNQDGDLVASPVYASSDMLVIIVTPTGSTGTQGQGVCIEAIFDEVGV